MLRISDSHLLDNFLRQLYFETGVSVSNFWLVILQNQSCIKNHAKSLWWSFWGNRGWILTVKNFTVLLHYLREVKYRGYIPKKTSFFIIEGKIHLGPLHETWRGLKFPVKINVGWPNAAFCNSKSLTQSNKVSPWYKIL